MVIWSHANYLNLEKNSINIHLIHCSLKTKYNKVIEIKYTHQKFSQQISFNLNSFIYKLNIIFI